MTREEERIEQIEQFASQCYEDGARYSAFISGAIWADNFNFSDSNVSLAAEIIRNKIKEIEFNIV